MKIKKKHSKQLDLKESWSEKLIEFIINEDIKIPVMTGMPKGEERASLHFTSLGRLSGIAEILKDNSNRFKTYSEVYRSAFYIGIMVLYRMHEKDFNKCEYNSSFWQSCQEFEPIMADMHIANHMVYMMGQLYEASQKKYIGFDEMRDKVDDLIDRLPENLKVIAKTKFKELLHGEKINNLYEMETWGGKR